MKEIDAFLVCFYCELKVVVVENFTDVFFNIFNFFCNFISIVKNLNAIFQVCFNLILIYIYIYIPQKFTTTICFIERESSGGPPPE